MWLADTRPVGDVVLKDWCEHRVRSRENKVVALDLEPVQVVVGERQPFLRVAYRQEGVA